MACPPHRSEAEVPRRLAGGLYLKPIVPRVFPNLGSAHLDRPFVAGSDRLAGDGSAPIGLANGVLRNPLHDLSRQRRQVGAGPVPNGLAYAELKKSVASGAQSSWRMSVLDS